MPWLRAHWRTALAAAFALYLIGPMIMPYNTPNATGVAILSTRYGDFQMRLLDLQVRPFGIHGFYVFDHGE